MLENMFVGQPPGNYDRLLDFSHAVTGTVSFVPSASADQPIRDRPRAAQRRPGFLENVAAISDGKVADLFPESDCRVGMPVLSPAAGV